MIAVEFPVPEAEALLARLAADGEHSMAAEECDAAEAGRRRLAQAVAVERGSCGSASIEDVAACLLGSRVRVRTVHGSVKTGVLRRVIGYRSLLIEDGHVRHAINASLVASIEVAREREAEAA